MSDHNGAVTNREAENSRGAKESGATMPKPPNLVGRAKAIAAMHQERQDQSRLE